MEPELRRLGNLRLVCTSHTGLSLDLMQQMAPIDEFLTEQKASGYGPVQMWMQTAPDDTPMNEWPVSLARACTGLPVSSSPILVEDYHNLQALGFEHRGALAEIPRTYRILSDHAAAHAWRLRPYWRLSFALQATPDGQAISTADVAVFLDR